MLGFLVGSLQEHRRQLAAVIDEMEVEDELDLENQEVQELNDQFPGASFEYDDDLELIV